jgi:ABC-type multidrug transport system fused ATPase/permease subunit
MNVSTVHCQATGIRIGTMLQNISNLGVGIILAFVYGWSLTLLMLAFIPLIVVAGFLQTYLLTGFANRVCRQEEEVSGRLNLHNVFSRTKKPWKMPEKSVEGDSEKNNIHARISDRLLSKVSPIFAQLFN